MDGGLHTVVYRRMGENGFVMQQIALGIKTDDLTSGTEPRVDTHDAPLPKRGREQQLPQVLGEDMDSFTIGLLLAQTSKLSFYRGSEQALVAILHRLGNQLPARCIAIDVMTLQALYTFAVVDANADTQDTLGFSSPHG